MGAARKHAPRPRDREALLDELVEQGVPGDETVDRAELVDPAGRRPDAKRLEANPRSLR